MGETETTNEERSEMDAREGDWREEQGRRKEAGRGGEEGGESVVEECEVKRVARGLKRAETRWVRCQG